jgi:hypothetical protein
MHANKQVLNSGANMKTASFSILTSAPAAILWGVLSIPAFGQPADGLVSGVARDSGSGKPVTEAQVIAHSLAKGTDRTTITDAGGIFTFTNLDPGAYDLAATKNGFQKSSAHVEVAASRTAHVDLPLVADSPVLTEREKKLLDRIERLEVRLAAMEVREASEKPAVARTTQGTEILLASRTPVALPAPDPAPQAVGKTSIPSPAAPVAPSQHIIPDALQSPAATSGVDNFTPFAFGDFTWLNGSPRTKDAVLDTKFFTPEVRMDTHFITDFNQPRDHSMGGSTEQFRSGEIQLEQISVGGDFHWENVRGRLLTMGGMFATTTPRNDPSSGVGQWDVRGAYRYFSEAYGGYHFNVNHGLNIDAGIFVSYIGLFSYYNFG